MTAWVRRTSASPQEAAVWSRSQVLATNVRTVVGRAYPRVRGLAREKSWVFFEILLPFLATSAFVFVYRALQAPPEYVGFVVLGGAMTAFWLNVIWMMAQQLWWEKSQGNLELYFAAPMSFMSVLLGMAIGGLIMSSSRAFVVLVVATAVYGVSFAVDQWLLLLAVFGLTLTALYGLGMVLAALFLMWGREAWHLTQLLMEPVYFVSGLNFPVSRLGFLGALAKGSKNPFKPDFLEAGDRVLDALELASPFTWHLAHRDLLGDEVFYGPTRRTPYVFVFCGTEDYPGLRGLVNEPGTDGTIRWAGAALNTRKILLDFTKTGQKADGTVSAPPPTNEPVPLIPLPGLNHGTILSEPSPLAVDLVASALRVGSGPEYESWLKGARARTQGAWGPNPVQWQQFVIRAVDERGDPVEDWNLKLQAQDGTRLQKFDLEVHVNRRDPSLRCFHVNLSKLKSQKGKLLATITAASSSRYVGYLTVPDVPVAPRGEGLPTSVFEGTVELDSRIGEDGITFFHPFTTTLLEIRLNREPLPPGQGIKNEVLWWDEVALDG